MRMFVFKLNVGPSVLEMYVDDMEKLIGHVIPEDLKLVFDFKDKKDNYLRYTFKDEYNDILASDEYKNLISKNKLSKTMYLSVEKEYHQSGKIEYSKIYMNNRTDFKQIIEDIESKFPILLSAKNIRLTNVFGGASGEVGMNKKYIQRADKIEKFINNDLLKASESKTEFIYNSKMEHIYLNAINESDALNIASSITDMLNHNENDINLKNVSINPLYDENSDITVKQGEYTKIKVERVFPNGDPSNRASAVGADGLELLRASKSAEEYTAPENGNLDVNNYISNPDIRDKINKGYLKVTYNKKSIIDNKIRMVDVSIEEWE